VLLLRLRVVGLKDVHVLVLLCEGRGARLLRVLIRFHAQRAATPMQILLFPESRRLEAFVDAADDCLHRAILPNDIVSRLRIIHLLVWLLSEASLVLEVHVARREEFRRRRLPIVNAAGTEGLLKAIHLYFCLVCGKFAFVSVVVHVAAARALGQSNIVSHSIIIIKVILGKLSHIRARRLLKLQLLLRRGLILDDFLDSFITLKRREAACRRLGVVRLLGVVRIAGRPTLILI
jgi:hypothetical protein